VPYIQTRPCITRRARCVLFCLEKRKKKKRDLWGSFILMLSRSCGGGAASPCNAILCQRSCNSSAEEVKIRRSRRSWGKEGKTHRASYWGHVQRGLALRKNCGLRRWVSAQRKGGCVKGSTNGNPCEKRGATSLWEQPFGSAPPKCCVEIWVAFVRALVKGGGGIVIKEMVLVQKESCRLTGP